MRSLKTILECCGHTIGRHILFENGNGMTKGNYRCLVGGCRCGGLKLKRKKAVKASQGKAWLYGREHYKKESQ